MTAPFTTAHAVDVHALPVMLTALRLPSFHRHWPALAERADKEGWPATRFLAALAEVELAERETRRIRRHLIESRLPGGKTLATFDFKALPSVPRARVEALAAGDWVETGANLIAIGNSGAGKTHLLCAVGHALVEAGRRVLYTRTTDLVQKLQAARRDLALEAALTKLDRFELIILDDIGYAQKTRPKPRSSSNSSPDATRPEASPSPPTSPSAPGTASSPTRPSPSPPSTGWSTTRPSSK
jgi:DNA replication protein DnaC